MNAWCHLPTIIKRRKVLRTAGLATLLVAFITTLFFVVPTEAAAGVNQNLNFQARLLNNSGGVVPDGYYNIQFKIYQDGDGQAVGTTGSPTGTPEWTESHINNNGSHGVLVKNGYLSVTLGSVTPFGDLVDWNQDTLWLSMNVAGFDNACVEFGTAPCAADGEMLPMKRLTATPFALNAARLGGFEADDFLQKTGSVQTGGLWMDEAVRSNTSLLAPVIDTATAGTLNIGSTNATSINLNQDVTVAAGKSLALAGGNTASRPASPTEGMLYYDTTTKQLLVYANGKWQSDGKSATKIVAASNSPQAAKDGADFVADGEAVVGAGTIDGDQIQINQAIAALPASGGSIFLTEGTYYLDDSIVLPNNVKLSGAGDATVITVNNNFGTGRQFIVNSDTVNGNTGIIIEHLKIDGNRANNGANGMTGIRFTNVGSGSGSSAVTGVVITNTKFVNLTGIMIEMTTSSNNTFSNNVFSYGASNGININSGVNNRVINNTFSSLQRAVDFNDVDYSIIANNSIDSSSTTINGAVNLTGGSSDNSISNNIFRNNANISLRIATSRNNIVSNNLFTDNGGTGSIDALVITGNSDNNTISRNTFRDTAGTGNAIYIGSSSADNNYLEGNSLAGPGANTISDGGTGTIYGGQTNNSGNYVIQPAGNTIELSKSTNVSGVLSATNAVLTPNLDRETAGTLTIGLLTSTSITMGRASANTAMTFQGTSVFKPTTGNDSTSAFQIQRANGTALFTADTVNQTITIGDPASANKTIISTLTGQIVKYGEARNIKQIRLAAEYTGSVLDAGTGSNNTGTMTSSVDLTNRMNYYRWVSSQTSAQTYDIVVQIPIPQDFSAWTDSNPLLFSTRTSNTSDGAINLELRDSTGSVQCDFVNLSTNTTWVTHTPSCLSGVYTPGDYLTMRIRVSSKDNASVDVGNIVLNYLSKY